MQNLEISNILNKNGNLKKDEVIAIVTYIQTNNDADATNRFIKNNMKLIHARAKRHHASRSGVDYEDIVQEGCIGLLRSLKTFDPSLGHAFTTYAVHWIDHYIRRYIADHGAMIRTPVHIQQKNQKISSFCNEYQQETGCDPCHDTIAERTKIKKKEVSNILRLTYLKTPLSLDTTVRNDMNEDLSIADFISDDRNMEDETINAMILPQLQTDLATFLTEQEYKALYLRFGLDGTDQRTLEECGHALGCSGERIRQVIGKALEKLAKNPQIRSKYEA